jgi:hypothetical protein
MRQLTGATSRRKRVPKNIELLEKNHCAAFVYTANILAVLSTAFGCVAFPNVMWLYRIQPMTAQSMAVMNLDYN